jgi:hypothetical protein
MLSYAEEWSLGSYQRQSLSVEATGAAASSGNGLLLDPLDLLPHRHDMAHRDWPYVKQVYGKGGLGLWCD